MNPALFPNLEIPTPAVAVAVLTKPERQQRLQRLIEQAQFILADAQDKHLREHTLAGRVVLFSGGNDSTVLLHLMKHLDMVDYAAHANTTIGIEETRQFVRDTCTAMQIPLLEKLPPKTYRELVLEKIDGKIRAFPGPGQHYFYYQRLKERCLRQVRRDLVQHPRRERVLFIAGRRRSESARRSSFRANGQAQVPMHEREGSVVWASPLLTWTKLDMVTYRAVMTEQGDPVPVNMVSELLHMSGECLCGCFAHENELAEIRDWFPATAAEIDALMADVRAAGVEGLRAMWGHAKGKPAKRQGPLCEDCQGVLF